MNRILLLSVFLFSFFAANAQISKGGIPLSISEKISPPNAIELVQPNWDKVREEDKGWLGEFRFAVPTDVDFTTKNSGKWTNLPDGSRLWQLHIHSEKAAGLALTLADFKLPQGAKLYMHAPDGKQILGSYDVDNNSESRTFFIGFINGKEAVLSYYEHKNTPNNTPTLPFVVKKVYHAYTKETLNVTGFGSGLACHINVNCPQGANWQTQKRGVVRIRVVATEGVGWCSGSLINTTRQDGTPYVLSAYHCADGLTVDFAQWTFFFNYESPNCDNPTTEPSLKSLQGCVARSGARETDFLLFELNQRIPADFNAHFNGWNRDSIVLPTSETMIHHPNGDIKKISLGVNAPTVLTDTITWSNNVFSPANTHLRYTLEQGGMERGSSGSPMFDQAGRIVAQLHGGINQADKCSLVYALGGWLAKSWNGNGTPTSRLKDWLDPTNSNVLTQDGTSTPSNTVRITGKLVTANGTALANQAVTIGANTTVTNATGVYTFNNVPVNTPVNVKIIRTTNPSNGVEAVDILLIRRHILGTTPITSKLRLFAADVDGNQEVDAVDMLQMRRVVLGIRDNLPLPSWRFVPSFVLLDTNFPFNLTIPDVFEVSFTASTNNFDFIGVKIGDVDTNADADQ
ncbi:MAG: dockerin type I domain-containing protein [Saprospiraceae bacterium]|nr:dockerin type I domain-containing protein [Saprospiraceae bacterium]